MMDNLNPFLYFLYFLLASQIIDVFHRLVWIVFSLYFFLHDLSSPVKFRNKADDIKGFHFQFCRNESDIHVGTIKESLVNLIT